jgi:hypothetical protein
MIMMKWPVLKFVMLLSHHAYIYVKQTLFIDSYVHLRTTTFVTCNILALNGNKLKFCYVYVHMWHLVITAVIPK